MPRPALLFRDLRGAGVWRGTLGGLASLFTGAHVVVPLAGRGRFLPEFLSASTFAAETLHPTFWR